MVYELMLLREFTRAVVALLLVILTVGMSWYVYRHRIALTVDEKEARSAAFGLAILFGALALRSIELWAVLSVMRRGWPHLPGTETAAVHIAVLGLAIVGAVITVKAFHPWPVWAGMVAMAVAVPILLMMF